MMLPEYSRLKARSANIEPLGRVCWKINDMVCGMEK